MDFLSAIPAILSGASALSSFFDRDKSGSETTSREPMPRDEDMQRAWDEFFDTAFGAEDRPGYGEMVQADDLAARQAANSFLTSLKGASGDLKSAINAMALSYANPMTAKIGDQTMSFVPTRQRQTAKDLLDMALQKYKLETGDAQTALNLALQFSPFKAGLQTYEEYKDIAERGEQRRYGLPSQTQSATYTEPFANTLMKSQYLAQPALEYFSNAIKPSRDITPRFDPRYPIDDPYIME